VLEVTPPSLIERERRGLMRALLSQGIAWYHRLTGLSRYDRHRLERVEGLHILVLPSVANPKLLRTGAFFASLLDTSAIRPSMSVLDLGTGSGVCALCAARLARRVVAVDLNPEALRCARINALINGLDGRVDWRPGDLFAPLAGERFDLVLFNPPFLLGEPRDHRDAAWRSADLPRRFAAGLDAHLNPGGVAWLLLSSFGDASAQFELELRRAGYRLAVQARRRYVNEIATVLRVSRSAA
jgi:methylase of polypeptide subunit release factors